MTEQATKILLEASADQFLLGEQEQAFIASCDKICVVMDKGDGWPGMRFMRPADARIEVLNSRALRLRANAVGPRDNATAQKVALLLIRLSDGQHLVLHGFLGASNPADCGDDALVRVSIASRCWSPEICGGPDPVIARALSRS